MELFFIFAGINFILGLSILYYIPRTRVNILFAVFAFSTGVLIFADGLLRIYPQVELLRLAFSILTLLPIIAVMWVSVFLNRKVFSTINIVLYIFGLLLALISFGSSLVVSNLEYVGLFGFKAQYGNLFWLFSLYLFFGIVLVVKYLLTSLKTDNRFLKLQVKYILCGLIISGIFGAIFTLLLPLFNNFSLNSLDSPSSTFFVAFTSYALFKRSLIQVTR